MTILKWTTVVAAVLALAAGPLGAVTPAQKCQKGQNREAGKYSDCRQEAEGKFALTADAAARAAALGKCLVRYNARWLVLEAAAGGTCPSAGGQVAIEEVLRDASEDVASRLAGGPPAGCSAELAACLAACPGAGGTLLQTGQETCWDSDGIVVSCSGTGQDGEIQKGLSRTYVDNGDGTVTDARTGLMWEKLSDDGSIHDTDNTYTWFDAFSVKVATLNDGGGFAGQTDWRLPNQTELLSLVDYGEMSPAVSPAFNTGCAASCTVMTCSCTRSTRYWTSTTFAYSTPDAWYVDFASGVAWEISKELNYRVRAVRGGS